MSFFARWLGFDGEEQCELGLAALDRRDFATAARAFETCAQSSRKESTIRLSKFHLAGCLTHLAETAFRNGDYEEALDQIERALSYSTATAERHLIAAQTSLRLGDREQANLHLDAALAKDSQNEQALALRALTLYEEGREEEALARAETLPPLDSHVRHFREAHVRGDRKAAMAHLRAVAAGYPASLL